MVNVQFRTGEPGDGEAIFRVLERAFGLEPGNPQWENRRREALESAATFQVAEVDGRLIGAARVQRHRLRVGQCALVKGDVGEVSITPDFQGQGYGSALMQHVVAWMSEHDFHLSRLGGLVRFYRRFGWVPFPRRYVEFPLTPVRAGARTLPAEAGLELPAVLVRGLRAYDPEHDAAGRAAVYYHFNHNRTGSLVTEGPPLPPPSVPLRPSPTPPPGPSCVFDRDGEMLGYLFATEYERDITEFEARLTIGDVAYRLDHPEALEAMLKHALRWAAQRGITRATARLPFDEEVLSVLRRAGISFLTVELETMVASNMLRIIDLAGLFESIRPELEERLSTSPYPDWRGRLAVGAETEKVVLEVERGRIRIQTATPGKRPGVRSLSMATDTATLMRLVLGLNGFGETRLIPPCPDRSAVGVLEALFPRQPTASGVWG